MPSSITNRNRKRKNNPADDNKCHRSCPLKIENTHSLLRFLDKEGVIPVFFSLVKNRYPPGSIQANMQNAKQYAIFEILSFLIAFMVQ